MTQIQNYILIDAARAFMIIVTGLVVMALLTQGLSQSDLILENGQSAAIYLKVVLLGSPKVVSLLLPLGLFVACVWSLNRIHQDSEIVVAQASGMTPWQLASPVMRLAVGVLIIHLVINLWIQPMTQREMRETLHDARVDLASTLIRPGEFTTAGNDLTFFARDNVSGELQGLLISDEGGEAADYLAETGRITKIDGKPALVMLKGQIHQVEDSGSLSILNFDRYVFDLAPFAREDSEIYYKAGDRFLPELVNIDPSNHYEASNRVRFLAEANYRLSAPLLGIAMTLLAVFAVLGGDYRRAGYLKRIAFVSTGSLALLFAHLSANAASVESVYANWLQWAVVLAASGVLAVWYFGNLRLPRLNVAPA